MNPQRIAIIHYTEERHPFSEEALPPIPPRGVMWVFVNEEGKPVSIDMQCPCGCGASCYTRVVAPGQHRIKDKEWEYESPATLRPSIRYLAGCKAHFTIEKGVVHFCPDSGK